MGKAHQRIVIKVGTGVLTRESTGELDHAMLSRLVQAISDLCRTGHEVLLVSSGAVGAGLPAFGLKKRPADQVTLLQACAAVGQARLMQIYDSGFRNYGFGVAQVLLIHEDFESDGRRANVQNTLNCLLEHTDIVPIINENDPVATFELRVGDNDKLSALVAKLVHANLLILLTQVPGLRGPGAKDENDIIREVPDIESVLEFANGEVGSLSVGGMKSKLGAVADVLAAGIETIIASGRNPEQLPALVAGEGICTRFRVPVPRGKSKGK